jgi:hypothetical protein
MNQQAIRLTALICRFAAAAFASMMVVIICIANQGEGSRWWAFIHQIPYGDKLGHLGLMGTLSLLSNLALTPRYLHLLRIPITRVTAILLLLISLEEVSQAFIPTRNFDLLDLLADIAGLAVGQKVGVLLRTRTFQHNHSI